MSGHSKWATTKHRKGAVDKARGKLFAKLIRQVEVAAREGGGDMNANATLRTMFAKARESSVPLDTIERAIKRGTGELEGVRYEAVAYEGYAPSGVALIVECLTDNRNRTGSEVRSLFSRTGGSMSEPGAVSWQFERKGVVMVPKSVGEDELMVAALDAGGEDLQDEGLKSGFALAVNLISTARWNSKSGPRNGLHRRAGEHLETAVRAKGIRVMRDISRRADWDFASLGGLVSLG